MAVSIVDRARIWLARGLVKAINLNIVSPWLTASFAEPTFRRMCEDGYRANGAIFACVSELAFSFPEARLTAYRQTDTGREPLPAHPLSKLLTRPNWVMGIGEFLQFHIIYLSIGGNCYWYKLRDKARRILELWPLHDGQITPIYDPKRLIDHYELDNGTDKPDEIPVEDIVHHRWLPDPLDPAHGLAPMIAVAREVDTDNEATRYVFALLKNDAVPRLAIKVPKEITLDQGQRDDLRKDWQAKQGGENRGRVAVLSGGLDVTRISLDMQELAFEAFRRTPEARIASAFRVPPIVAGLNVGLERSTYSNYEEAVRSFTTRTLVPLWVKTATQATASLAQDYKGEDVITDFDLASVVALAEAMQSKRQWVDGAVGRGYLTRNEARSELKYPRVAGGDVFLMPMNVLTEQATLETPAVGGGGGGKGTKAKRRAYEYNGEEHKRVWNRFIRRTIGYEKVLTRTVVGLFEQQRDDVLARLRAPKSAQIVTDEPFDQAKWLQEFRDKVRPVLVTVTEDAGQGALDDLAVTQAFNVNEPAVVRFLEARAQRFARRVNETTWDELKKSLAEGINAGENITQLEERVMAVMDGRIRSTPETIARTEVIGAANGGTLEAWRQSDVVETKIWMATLDPRTRDSHVDAHGQEVGLDEDFDVGSGRGPAPGQIGVAGEDINCRCTMAAGLKE